MTFSRLFCENRDLQPVKSLRGVVRHFCCPAVAVGPDFPTFFRKIRHFPENVTFPGNGRENGKEPFLAPFLTHFMDTLFEGSGRSMAKTRLFWPAGQKSGPESGHFDEKAATFWTRFKRVLAIN